MSESSWPQPTYRSVPILRVSSLPRLRIPPQGLHCRRYFRSSRPHACACLTSCALRKPCGPCQLTLATAVTADQGSTSLNTMNTFTTGSCGWCVRGSHLWRCHSCDRSGCHLHTTLLCKGKAVRLPVHATVSGIYRIEGLTRGNPFPKIKLIQNKQRPAGLILFVEARYPPYPRFLLSPLSPVLRWLWCAQEDSTPISSSTIALPGFGLFLLTAVVVLALAGRTIVGAHRV